MQEIRRDSEDHRRDRKNMIPTKIELSIDLTYECPCSCAFCSTPSNFRAGHMGNRAAEMCVEFSKYLIPKDKTFFTFTGGEPLVIPNLIQLLSIFNKNDVIITLCTNATLIKDEDYWVALRNSGVQMLNVSLHSVDRCSSRNIFGHIYDFSSVDENIRRAKRVGIIVNANYLITRINAGNFEQIADYCAEAGINKIRILRLAQQGKAIDNWSKLAIDYETEQKVLSSVQKISKAYSFDLEFAGFHKYKKCTHIDNVGKCSGGRNFFHITVGGDIFACPSVKAIPSKKLGSIFDIKNLIIINDIPHEKQMKHLCS